MKQNYFSEYHPMVILTFFTAAIVFSVILNHPVFLLISSFCSFCCCILSNGIKSTLRYAVFCVPLVLLSAIINPLFNHTGNTPLLFINSQPITLEAVVYGLSSGCMVLAMVFWFACFHKTLGNYKMTALFGGILPSITLIVTMVFRFIPYFGRQIKLISATQKTLHNSTKDGLTQKIRLGGAIMSALLSVSLESTMSTADSMRARGYGLKGRTRYQNRKITTRDRVLFLWCAVGIAASGLSFIKPDYTYFPELSISLSSSGILLSLCYGVFLCTPVIITAWEELRWIIVQNRI